MTTKRGKKKEILNPCPVCGREPSVDEDFGSIECRACELYIPTPLRNYELSGKIWNSLMQEGETNSALYNAAPAMFNRLLLLMLDFYETAQQLRYYDEVGDEWSMTKRADDIEKLLLKFGIMPDLGDWKSAYVKKWR